MVLTSFVGEKVTSFRRHIEPACSWFDWRVVIGGWGRAWRRGTCLIGLLVIRTPTEPSVITPVCP